MTAVSLPFEDTFFPYVSGIAASLSLPPSGQKSLSFQSIHVQME